MAVDIIAIFCSAMPNRKPATERDSRASPRHTRSPPCRSESTSSGRRRRYRRTRCSAWPTRTTPPSPCGLGPIRPSVNTSSGGSTSGRSKLRKSRRGRSASAFSMRATSSGFGRDLPRDRVQPRQQIVALRRSHSRNAGAEPEPRIASTYSSCFSGVPCESALPSSRP